MEGWYSGATGSCCLAQWALDAPELLRPPRSSCEVEFSELSNSGQALRVISVQRASSFCITLTGHTSA